MNHGLMRGYIDTTVLFRTGQTKHVVILVDGAAYGTQRVMAVGQYIGHGELLQSGCSCGLNDAYKGNIMAGQLIETDLQLIHIAGSIMFPQDTICHGVFRCFFSGDRNAGLRLYLSCCFGGIRYNICTVYQVSAALC